VSFFSFSSFSLATLFSSPPLFQLSPSPFPPLPPSCHFPHSFILVPCALRMKEWGKCHDGGRGALFSLLTHFSVILCQVMKLFLIMQEDGMKDVMILPGSTRLPHEHKRITTVFNIQPKHSHLPPCPVPHTFLCIVPCMMTRVCGRKLLHERPHSPFMAPNSCHGRIGGKTMGAGLGRGGLCGIRGGGGVRVGGPR
jgi:hypothetical protein